MHGDATKAKDILGWEAKTTLDKPAEEMVLSDLDQVKTVLKFLDVLEDQMNRVYSKSAGFYKSIKKDF